MKRKALYPVIFLFLSLLASGQESKKIVVYGKVTDPDKKPVSGITIFADKMNTGKATSRNGSYRVKIPAGTEKIRVISESGEIAESKIDGREVVNIELPSGFSSIIDLKKMPAEKSVADEDINIGYGTVKSKNLTTPVNKVRGNENNIFYKDIYEMLRGQPGVQIQGKSIRIQNASSFMSSTEPLLVVDGVPVSSIDDVVPQEVRSIEILKGASASIYGSRGANGVILITLRGAR
jgi:TonB-dependent SusC/RagA subfamily outer membrane receptor